MSEEQKKIDIPNTTLFGDDAYQIGYADGYLAGKSEAFRELALTAEVTYEEAFARFQQRQESPEKRKLERLKQLIEYELYKLKDYDGDPVSLHTKELLEREAYVYKKIEKELNE